MLDYVLRWLGAGDAAIAAMGPIATWVLAWVFGGALTQFVKLPVSVAMRAGPLFDWTIRAVAMSATFFFAHVLSSSLHWSLEFGIAVTQPLFYHVTLRLIRHRWPWLEVYTLVGSVDPPAAAYRADAQRKADGQDSGV